MAPELAELLSDARTYLEVGDAQNGIAVVFEALREHTSAEAERAVVALVAKHFASLWRARKRDEGKSLSKAFIDERLRQTGNTIDPGYLDLYTTALAETGSPPFPFKRMFRQHNLVRVFRTAQPPDAGEVAECGCARGLSFLQLLLAERQRRPGFAGEAFHIFDSFAGLSEPGAEDVVDDSAPDSASLAANMRPGQFAVTREIVSGNVHRLFPRAELHAGWIPDVFASEPERRYRFVHLDVDLYQPTLAALEYFFPRLARGAIVITDDYAWPGAKKAIDEFARENALALELTGTDQAYFVNA